MPIVEVEHVTKEFELGEITGLRQSVTNRFNRLVGRPVEERKTFKALDDVNFTIERGEVVGFIGHNGAGKSTLLKLLANITKPTRGRVSVQGRVAPLIEVGAGMVPNLTGRENIFLNASILGIGKKRIAGMVDEIVEFAELEEFIDTPIKRYSSGMRVRLGFAIATSIDAEVLIVDEVLAVGDLAFQRKCFDRMEDLIKGRGNTVLLVSHNIRQVARLCTRAFLLDHGRIVSEGATEAVCEEFYRSSNAKIAAQIAKTQTHDRHVRKTEDLELESLTLVNEQGVEAKDIAVGQPVTIRCVLNAKRFFDRPEIVLGVHTTDFFYIASMGNAHIEARPDVVPGSNEVLCRLPNMPLMPGVYALRLGVLDQARQELFYGEMLLTFRVNAGSIPATKLPMSGIVFVPAEWSFGESSLPCGASKVAPSSIRGSPVTS
jgi:ABC-type polysaccharide/polyol phosphate transport system ATPase subunit